MDGLEEWLVVAVVVPVVIVCGKSVANAGNVFFVGDECWQIIAGQWRAVESRAASSGKLWQVVERTRKW